MSPFDCVVCGCSVSTHSRKVWPSFTPKCDNCADCTGYTPRYRTGGNKVNG